MKRMFLCCVMGLVVLCSAARSQAQNDGATEKAVVALEQQWMKSQQTNNPELMVPLLAEKFVATGADGKVLNKEQEVAEAKGTKYSSMEYEDVKVIVFGTTAIATGGSKATGTGPDGKPVGSHVRWTDTWVKMPSGKWQCVASHVSNIKM